MLGDDGIFITRIIPGGTADENGTLAVGDRILEVIFQAPCHVCVHACVSCGYMCVCMCVSCGYMCEQQFIMGGAWVGYVNTH